MSITPHQIPVAVHEALQRGETIEAIKHLREATGLGLKEAKDVVDALQRGDTVNISVKAKSETLSPAALAALQNGNKIEAIKLVREQTGLGLKEAKDAVEAAQRGLEGTRGLLVPAVASGSGGVMVWLALAIVALVICYGLSLL